MWRGRREEEKAELPKLEAYTHPRGSEVLATGCLSPLQPPGCNEYVGAEPGFALQAHRFLKQGQNPTNLPKNMKT